MCAVFTNIAGSICSFLDFVYKMRFVYKDVLISLKLNYFNKCIIV